MVGILVAMMQVRGWMSCSNLSDGDTVESRAARLDVGSICRKNAAREILVAVLGARH